jgi:acetoin utilization protein AcuC
MQCSNAALRELPARFVASDYCGRPGFGRNHPLSIPRVGAVLELCRLLGWLDAQEIERSGPASVAELTVFHDPAYVTALESAVRSGMVEPEVRERHGFGTLENPIFADLFERAATQVGGSLRAAELAAQGRIVFHPAGGTHHGRPDRASGFCYFNDPVFAVRRLQELGAAKVLYVDLDAHHGDGVQDAFRNDPEVAFVSIHEVDRWPHTGALAETDGGKTLNLPVPSGLNDSEFSFLLEELVLPFARRFRADAVVITCGTDALAGDPLSRLELSNLALWDAVEQLARLAAPVVVLGGGGYNPWTLARCWTGLWARLSGREIPVALPEAAQVVLRMLHCDLVEEDEIEEQWINTLADRPRHGPVRPGVSALVEQGRSLHGLA